MVNALSARIASETRSLAKQVPLIGMLGWQDVKQRYRRSMLGPFWLTISMGVMIGSIGFVFGHIFKSPMREFLPFLTVGLVLWGFVSSVIIEGCSGFTSAEGVIRQLPIPLYVHVARVVWRNTLVMAHNMIILPVILLAVGKPITWIAFESAPGFIVVVANVGWMALILAVICARYRDLPQIVASGLQVIYFVTPIIWMPNVLDAREQAYMLIGNPFFHLIEICRAPLLGQESTISNWIVSLAMTFAGWIIALAVYRRYRGQIVYWL